MTYASPVGHALIDRALYLPCCWADDPQRRVVAGIPADLRFATKSALARLLGVADELRTTELNAGDDPAVGDMLIEQARQRATPVLIDVLCRYTSAPIAHSRIAQLMSTLNAALRESG